MGWRRSPDCASVGNSWPSMGAFVLPGHLPAEYVLEICRNKNSKVPGGIEFYPEMASVTKNKCRPRDSSLPRKQKARTLRPN